MPDAIPPITVPATGPSPLPSPRDAALRKAAEQLESSFPAEMLSFAGVNKPPQAFGGGIGEAQFASFLDQAQAEAMVKHGGIGLADKLYAELKERADAER